MRCYDDAHRLQHRKETTRSGLTMGVGLMLGLLFALMIFVGSAANSNDLEKYHEIVVESGDTLWELAQGYVQPDEDIRHLIAKIRRINDLESAEIHPGQIILIPAS